MKKVDFSKYTITNTKNNVNQFHLEYLNEEYAKENRTKEMNWSVHKMIPILSWANNETLIIDMTLWLSREGLYYITFDKWETDIMPISFEYGIGFKTANDAIKYYSI